MYCNVYDSMCTALCIYCNVIQCEGMTCNVMYVRTVCICYVSTPLCMIMYVTVWTYIHIQHKSYHIEGILQT